MPTFEQSAKTLRSVSVAALYGLIVGSLRHWLSDVQRPASRALPRPPMNVDHSFSAVASQALVPMERSLSLLSLSSSRLLEQPIWQPTTKVRERRARAEV